MITERLNAVFNEMTEDVGQELKDTARRIYVRALRIFLVVAALEIICAVAIGASADDTDITPLGWFLAATVAVWIEFPIFWGILRVATLQLYAKGEIVHLLKNNCVGEVNRNTVHSQMPAQNVQGKAEQITRSERSVPTSSGSWCCWRCGTENSKNYSQCKKCGVFRNGEIPRQEIKQEKSVAEETPSVEIDSFWICKHCGTENKQQYGQCKKCGTFRG